MFAKLKREILWRRAANVVRLSCRDLWTPLPPGGIPSRQALGPSRRLECTAPLAMLSLG